MDSGQWTVDGGLMYPVLCRIGAVPVYSYGLTLLVALLVVAGLATRAARRLPPQLVGIPAELILDFSCVSLLGGIAGARLLYVVIQWDDFAHAPWQIPQLWHGGLVWYGGFLGGVLAAWLYVRAKRLVFLRVMDQFIPFLALGHAIGRIGCFLNGCCYGRPTQAWCGVVFPGHAEPVLPTQLFEAGGLFLFYAVLRRLQRPALLSRPGRVFGSYLVSYASLRFVLEFFRGDQPAIWASLTLQQLVSIAALAVGLWLLSPRHKPQAANLTSPGKRS